MSLPSRARLSHEVPQWVPDGSFYLISVNCEPRGQNQLCRDGIGEQILAAAEFNHTRVVWHCRIMLLMPDHLHAVIAFPRDPGIKTTVTNWKQFLARKLHISWQRDFFDHRLRDHHQEAEKISYILMNPVRKGLCDCSEDWRWVYRPNDRVAPSQI